MSPNLLVTKLFAPPARPNLVLRPCLVHRLNEGLHPSCKLTLVLLLLWAVSVLAMSSTNFRLDWFTPMTSAGGGAASSANYAVNFTMGQTVIGTSASAHHGFGLGYWFDLLANILRNYLPLAVK